MNDSQAILLLGEDYSDYGEVEVRCQHNASSVAALTVGSDSQSPSRVHKGRADLPNEDGLFLLDQGTRTLLAVADGHHGHEASHHLLRAVAAMTERGLPANPLDLLAAVRDCRDETPGADYPAATTLLVAICDWQAGRGFGVSFGDSSLAVIPGGGVDSPQTSPESWYQAAANLRNTQFVHPPTAASLDPRRAVEFAFEVHPGELVVAFTDGIDGCHYGHPASSVRPAQLWSLWSQAHGEVESFVRSAIALALAGVDGMPGGQDNIAMVASSAR